jgi:hypothetical protein
LDTGYPWGGVVYIEFWDGTVFSEGALCPEDTVYADGESYIEGEPYGKGPGYSRDALFLYLERKDLACDSVTGPRGEENLPIGKELFCGLPATVAGSGVGHSVYPPDVKLEIILMDFISRDLYLNWGFAFVALLAIVESRHLSRPLSRPVVPILISVSIARP